VIVLLRTFAASSELDAFLIHVLDVFRGEIRECVVHVLQKCVKVGDVCRIEILSALWIKVPRLGRVDLRVALLEVVDPICARSDATDVEYKGIDVVSVEGLCNSSLVADPLHKCCLL